MLLVAIAASAAVAVGFAYLARDRAYTQPQDVLEGALAAEIALATDQGLVAAPERVVRESSVSLSLTVEAGECIALVAASEGVTPLQVSLHVGTLGPVEDGDLVHVAACASEAGPASLQIVRFGPAPFEIEQTIRYTVLRGHVRDPRSYARLSIGEAQRAAFDALAVRARMSLHTSGGRTIGGEWSADGEHAVLLPASRATWAGLRALAGRLGAVPAVSPEQAASDPFAAASDTPVPARVFTPDGQRRVIAVIDAGALGAGCVEILLARLEAPTRAATVTRVSVPDLATVTLPVSDPALTIDAICPARGLFAYTVPEGEVGSVVVVAARSDAESAVAPEPSHFGDAVGGRHPSTGLVVLPVALVAWSRAACATGEVEACLALAALAHDRIEGAGTVRDALEPLCDRSGGAACDVLAGAITDDAPREADSFERRACATGAADACMRRGARYLEAARDLAQALRTFRFGCAHGCADCCTAASTMREWQLAPPDAPAEEPAEPG